MSQVNKKKKKKIHMPHYNFKIAKLFEEAGYLVDIDEWGWCDADAVVFVGGPDVSPFLYGEKALKVSNCSLGRDRIDNMTYRNLESSVPKIGICRGAQFLNVMNGGLLYQDVDNHRRNHIIRDHETGEEINVSSTHHQMMSPSLGDRVDVIASAQTATFKQAAEYINEKKTGHWKEWHDPEVVFYQDTNSLCVQYHPEYMHKQSQGHLYFWRLINRCFEDQL